MSGGINTGAARMKSAVIPPTTSRKSQKTVDATRHALLPFSSSSLKTGTNADDRAVGDERADEIRDLKGDGEGVDRPACTEVVRRDDLADEDRARGRDPSPRKDGCRPREPVRLGSLLHERV